MVSLLHTGDWVQNKCQIARDYYDNVAPWWVAGATNTLVDIGNGIGHYPSSLGHLGEGMGCFVANPTLENAGAACQDVATFTGTVAGAAGAIKWAGKIGPDLAPWDPDVSWKGGEIVLSDKNGFTKARINSTGDWDNNNPLARRPHYHRRGPGGIGAHHPWEKGW